MSRSPITGGGGAPPSVAGTSGARPVATGSGKIYLCTDVPVMYFDDPLTTAWKQYATEYMPAPASAASYTAAGNLTLIQYADAIKVASTSNSNTVGSCGLIAGSLPQGSPWTVTLCATWLPLLQQTYPELGVVVSNGTTTGASAARGLFVFVDGTAGIGVHQLVFVVGAGRTSANNEVTAFSPNPFGGGTGRLHLRLLNDSTNLHHQVSTDGFFWQDWFTEATPSGLTNYGFAIGNEFNSGVAYVQALIYENLLGSVAAQQTITAATGNGVPVQVTVGSVAGFDVGDWCAIHGMVGNTSANSGTGSLQSASGFFITAINAGTKQITLSTNGNGTWTSGGVITNLSR